MNISSISEALKFDVSAMTTYFTVANNQDQISGTKATLGGFRTAALLMMSATACDLIAGVMEASAAKVAGSAIIFLIFRDLYKFCSNAIQWHVAPKSFASVIGMSWQLIETGVKEGSSCTPRQFMPILWCKGLFFEQLNISLIKAIF